MHRFKSYFRIHTNYIIINTKRLKLGSALGFALLPPGSQSVFNADLMSATQRLRVNKEDTRKTAQKRKTASEPVIEQLEENLLLTNKLARIVFLAEAGGLYGLDKLDVFLCTQQTKITCPEISQNRGGGSCCNDPLQNNGIRYLPDVGLEGSQATLLSSSGG